jgi:hypothetical protein
MLRFVFIGALALSLAGCESDADFWQPVDNAWPFGDSQPAPPAYDNAHCQAIAYERAADAKANGYDDESREIVYSGTYAECVAWDKQHPEAREN